jgi:hypothetical protein
MHEEIRYPACPYRNVPAAYQRFFGPDSGGIERFCPDAPASRTDGTLLIVRLHGKRAVSGAVHALEDFKACLSAAAARLALHRMLRLYRAEIHRPA